MGNWGPKGFARSRSGIQAKNLSQAVENLSPKAKQAMYAATSHGVIARGTWSGCAFNAAGNELGDLSIRSTSRAAELFEMKEADVRTFITLWDNSRFRDNDEATLWLQDKILDVGLFTEPVGKKKFAGQSFVQVVHKSDATEMQEEFDSMVENLSLDDCSLDENMLQFKDAAREAGDLLFA